jgi:hypothetical protein
VVLERQVAAALALRKTSSIVCTGPAMAATEGMAAQEDPEEILVQVATVARWQFSAAPIFSQRWLAEYEYSFPAVSLDSRDLADPAVMAAQEDPEVPSNFRIVKETVQMVVRVARARKGRQDRRTTAR